MNCKGQIDLRHRLAEAQTQIKDLEMENDAIKDRLLVLLKTRGSNDLFNMQAALVKRGYHRQDLDDEDPGFEVPQCNNCAEDYATAEGDWCLLDGAEILSSAVCRKFREAGWMKNAS